MEKTREENPPAILNFGQNIRVVNWDSSLVQQTSEKTVADSDLVFFVVEKSATFLGGDLETFRTWVQMHIVYPMEAEMNHETGKLILQFTINRQGFVGDVKILRSSGSKSLDAEGVRVINLSPRWTPGMQKGKPVIQLFTMPLVFFIQ